MAHLWQTAREWLHKRNPHRLTPVFEVLKTQEEAKDHVYYDALRRISASNSKDGQTINEGTSSVSRKRQNSDIDRNGNVPSRSLEDVTEEDVEESPTQPRPRTLFRYVFVVREFILQALKSERFVVDSEDDVYYLWMGLVAAAVIFNFWTVILRIAFFQQTREESLFRLVFWLGDLLADGLYTCDIGVQLRTAYRDDHGIMVKDPLQLVEKYRKKRRFKVDLICVLPLETLSHLFFVPCRVSLLRLPRLLKWHSVQTFFLLSDYRTSKPNHLRAFKLILYLGVAMHWVACLYYTISEYEGLGTNDWVYSGEHDHFTRKYVKSFYWSVLTLMTIGETPSPHTNLLFKEIDRIALTSIARYKFLEYIFTGCMFLLGIFVFATVVGNVGDVISNMNAARTNFQARMDSIKQFMEHHKVPKTLQTRVKRWAHYSWSRTQALEEGASLEVLPERLRAEIAIHVHLDTLRKVKIFKDCEQGLLCELVLKLRPQIFSPGDYICRSGEVGREMYIINNGKVEVVIPDSCTGEEVAVASLSEGNYFGEISLLRLDGGRNRRSADVRSVGYSELLCLSQKDLMEALEEYPDAKTVLESQGRDRLQRTKWEGHLSVPRTDQESEKFHEMGTNLAREIKVIKDVLEELRENAREVPGRVTIQELQKEFLDLKTQVRQQTEELHRLKRQITSQNHLLPGDTRRSKSNKEALLAEKLIQRVISAANLASHNANNSQKSRTLNGVEHAQEHPSTKPDSLARDPPDIYLESEIDGLCYLGGTHRTSVNLPVRGCNSGNLEPNASLDKLEGGGNE